MRVVSQKVGKRRRIVAICCGDYIQLQEEPNGYWRSSPEPWAPGLGTQLTASFNNYYKIVSKSIIFNLFLYNHSFKIKRRSRLSEFVSFLASLPPKFATERPKLSDFETSTVRILLPTRFMSHQKMIRFEKPGPPKLLVVLEHPTLRAKTRKILEASGYAVVEAACCKEAIAIMHACSFAVIIVDNDISDYENASPLLARSAIPNMNTPFIVLATSRLIRKHVNGFNAALDDYLYKPFRPHALVKHVRAVLKTPDGFEKLWHEYTDKSSLKEATRASLKKLNLPSKQMIFLYTLVNNSPRVVSKTYFVDILKLQKKEPTNTHNALESLVYRLRKRLRDGESNVSIKSVRGIGYRASIKEVSKQQV